MKTPIGKLTKIAEFTALDGYTPVKGVDYFDGRDAPTMDEIMATVKDGVATILEDTISTLPMGMMDGSDHRGGAGFHVGDLPGYKDSSVGDFFGIQSDGKIGFSPLAAQEAGSTMAVTQDAKVNEGGGITAGQLVYISGATGGFPQISLADNTDFSKADVVGIANEDKSNNQTITMTLVGVVTDLDTSAFSEGEILYLGTGGNITANHPTGIDATIRVGKAGKINANTGSIIFNIDSLTVLDDSDSIIRHQIVNQNAGTSASTTYTMVNDADQRASISMVGSNYTAFPGLASTFVIYNQGYGRTINAVDGNHSFEWWTDVSDSHNLSATMKMTLSAAGLLTMLDTTTTGTVMMTGLPTSDPSNAGELWNNSGILTVSAG